MSAKTVEEFWTMVGYAIDSCDECPIKGTCFPGGSSNESAEDIASGKACGKQLRSNYEKLQREGEQ